MSSVLQATLAVKVEQLEHLRGGGSVPFSGLFSSAKLEHEVAAMLISGLEHEIDQIREILAEDETISPIPRNGRVYPREALEKAMGDEWNKEWDRAMREEAENIV